MVSGQSHVFTGLQANVMYQISVKANSGLIFSEPASQSKQTAAGSFAEPSVTYMPTISLLNVNSYRGSLMTSNGYLYVLAEQSTNNDLIAINPLTLAEAGRVSLDISTKFHAISDDYIYVVDANAAFLQRYTFNGSSFAAAGTPFALQACAMREPQIVCDAESERVFLLEYDNSPPMPNCLVTVLDRDLNTIATSNTIPTGDGYTAPYIATSHQGKYVYVTTGNSGTYGIGAYEVSGGNLVALTDTEPYSATYNAYSIVSKGLRSLRVTAKTDDHFGSTTRLAIAGSLLNVEQTLTNPTDYPWRMIVDKNGIIWGLDNNNYCKYDFDGTVPLEVLPIPHDLKAFTTAATNLNNQQMIAYDPARDLVSICLATGTASPYELHIMTFSTK